MRPANILPGLRAIGAGLASVSPVRLAFFGSLLLSLVAVLGVVTIGRDGALYIDIAQQISLHGPHVAWDKFDWPWFSFLLAGTHLLLRIPLEGCAYLWCALFLAGTCALMVDCVRQRIPQAGYWACLVMLGMPAVNQFRNDIIREFGFWFFCTLAIWLAMRWETRGGWRGAALVHLAVLGATLFRPEALLLIASLMAWQVPGLRHAEGRKRFAQLLALPLLGALVLGAAFVLKGGWHLARLDYFLGLVEPGSLFASFKQLSQQFADSLINKYSADEAGRIILFGLAASLLIKLVHLMGPFALPFLQPRQWRGLALYWQAFRPAAIVALLYLAVLMLFFVRLQFMNGRYLSFVNLLLVPLLALVLYSWAEQFPRLARWFVALGVLMMLANVISFGTPKTQYVQAGQWVGEHVPASASVYYEDGRIAYYAGRGYPLSDLTREAAMAPGSAEHYQYFVVESGKHDAWLEQWLKAGDRRVLASFANRKGDRMVIIGR